MGRDHLLAAWDVDADGPVPPAELDQFEALLEVPDQDLYYWIIGREPPAPEHDHPVLHRVQAFHLSAYADGPHTGGG